MSVTSIEPRYALTYALEDNPVRGRLGFTEGQSAPPVYQDSYPSLDGAKWPKKAWRVYWHRLVSRVRRLPRVISRLMATCRTDLASAMGDHALHK